MTFHATLLVLQQLRYYIELATIPHSCPRCNKPTGYHGFCSECWRSIPWTSSQICYYCGDPYDYSSPWDPLWLCFECSQSKGALFNLLPARKNPLFFLRSLGIYQEPLRSMILSSKYSDNENLARALGALLLPLYTALPMRSETSPILTIVPSHSSRIRKRLYNLPFLLAVSLQQELHRKTPQSSWPLFEPRLLQRLGPLHSQKTKTQSERFISQKHAFKLHKKTTPSLLKQRHVIIVDDVSASGATLSYCSQALLDAGAQAVSALVLAKPLLERRSNHGDNFLEQDRMERAWQQAPKKLDLT